MAFEISLTLEVFVAIIALVLGMWSERDRWGEGEKTHLGRHNGGYLQ